METMQWRGYLGDAIHYWEPRRIPYNPLLAVTVIFHFVKGLPFSKTVVQFNSLLFLLVRECRPVCRLHPRLF